MPQEGQPDPHKPCELGDVEDDRIERKRRPGKLLCVAELVLCRRKVEVGGAFEAAAGLALIGIAGGDQEREQVRGSYTDAGWGISMVAAVAARWRRGIARRPMAHAPAMPMSCGGEEGQGWTKRQRQVRT